MQLAATHSNISQNIMRLVETELITAQGNICNMLDAKLEGSISLLIQYLSVQTQENCGSGLWHVLPLIGTFPIFRYLDLEL